MYVYGYALHGGTVKICMIIISQLISCRVEETSRACSWSVVQFSPWFIPSLLCDYLWLAILLKFGVWRISDDILDQEED